MSTISPIASASQIQMDYMKLLVTQLQNQNPLEPMNNQEMAAQLAQFSQLSQLESISGKLDKTNTSFQQLLDSIQFQYANSLIGKKISFYTDQDGQPVLKTAVVDKVTYDTEKKETILTAGEFTVPLAKVVSVENQ